MTLEDEQYKPGSKYFIQVSSQLPGPLEPLEFVHPANIEAITYHTTRYTCGSQVLIVHHGPVGISAFCLDRVPYQDRVLPPGSAYHECICQYALDDWKGNRVGDLFIDEVQHYGDAEELPDNKGWTLPYVESFYAGYFQQEVALDEFEKLMDNNGKDQQIMQELVMFHLNGKHTFI